MFTLTSTEMDAVLRQDLDALLVLKAPAAVLKTEHVTALPNAEPLPAFPVPGATPLKPPAQVPANRRMIWIVTALRALAAQQA
jgi:hypothetical protein